jgi:hypothetical protein
VKLHCSGQGGTTVEFKVPLRVFEQAKHARARILDRAGLVAWIVFGVKNCLMCCGVRADFPRSFLIGG